MSAIDCKLGPRTWSARFDGGTVEIWRTESRNPLYAYACRVRHAGKCHITEGSTAQEAVDRMEEEIPDIQPPPRGMCAHCGSGDIIEVSP